MSMPIARPRPRPSPRGLLVLLAPLWWGCVDEAVTPTDPSPTARDLMERGAHDVGFRELEVTYEAVANGGERTLALRLWYPAVAGSEGPARYAVAGIVEVPADGALDGPAVASGGPFPLAVYSHGNAGDGLLAYPYAELFASHGFIVVAPNHTGNSALQLLDMSFDPFVRTVVNRPADVSAVIDWAATELPDDLAGQAETDAVFLFGHSFGAFTTFAGGGVDLDDEALRDGCAADCELYDDPAIAAALAADLGDERVVAIAPQAPALVPFYGAGELGGLSVPTLLMSARRDITTTDAAQAIPAWSGLDHPDDLWVELPDGGHLSFITVCDDLDASLLELFQPSFRDDGCGESFTPTAEAVPALAGYLLGFARQHVLGESFTELLTGAPFHPDMVVSTH